MRTIKAIFASVVLSLALMACNNNKHAEENPNTTVDTTNNGTTGTYRSGDLERDFETTKRDLKSAWNQRMDEIDREIDDLDTRIEEEKGESKETWKQRKSELKNESAELRRKLDDVDNTSEDKWESFKDEVENDVEGLKKSVNNFFEDNEDKNQKNQNNNQK